MIIRHYSIELQTYHTEIVGRLQFNHPDHGHQESGLYSIGELNNIVQLWQDNALCGSFAIGTTLARDAACTLTLKADTTC